MDQNSPHERGLFKVMVIATSVSFGLLGAIMVSMRNFFTAMPSLNSHGKLSWVSLLDGLWAGFFGG
jgi:hypothetical protein